MYDPTATGRCYKPTSEPAVKGKCLHHTVFMVYLVTFFLEVQNHWCHCCYHLHKQDTSPLCFCSYLLSLVCSITMKVIEFRKECITSSFQNNKVISKQY